MPSFVTSRELYAQANEHFPGGVGSPVRAFRAVGGDPIFFSSGAGAWLTSVDGNSYVDHMLAWGPLLLGHAHKEVVRAIADCAAKGVIFGAPNPHENELAVLVKQAVPSIQKLRFVNSGTEATMSAIRVARAFTKRELIVKFEGCYHGHADALLVRAGSGVATLGLPDSPGVPQSAVSNTLVAPFNDADYIRQLFAFHGDRIAAVLVEPVAGNMGVVAPKSDFLSELRELTSQHGSILIFDEIMCGFRAHARTAQELYGVVPDITTLGKVVGGGLPIGVYGGKAEIMQLVAPQGPVYQAGTFSGNPLTMAAAIATLSLLQSGELWARAASYAEQLDAGIVSAARHANIPVVVQRAGTMLTLFFTDTPVYSWSDAARCDTDRFARVFRTLISNGVYWVPSQFESAFTSVLHSETELSHTLNAFAIAFATEAEYMRKAQ